MKRIRYLGLGVLATLALTLTSGAASASASGFIAESYPATVEAPETTQTLRFGAGTVPYGCHLGLVGTAAEATTSLSASPTGGACERVEPTEKGNMLANGCTLIFHPGEATGTEKSKGTFDIGPAGCGPIRIKTSPCERVIPAQTGLYAEYETLGSGKEKTVRISVNASFKYTPTGPSYCGNSGTGSWTGTWEVHGRTIGGTPNGLRVDSIPTGLFMSGKASENEAEQPRFDAEAFPVDVFGTQNATKTHIIRRSPGGLPFACATVNFTRKALAGATKDLTASPAYEGCNSTGPFGESWPTNINASGCSYVFHALNTGPPYSGNADVVCSEGAAITATVFVSKEAVKPLCTVQFPAQTGLSGVSYSNNGSGSARTIGLELAIAGLKSTRTGSALCGAAELKTGTYGGASTLVGLR